MSKSSCISHNARQQIVIIREDYLIICDDNHCAAALLNIFEYWTNIKLGNQEQAQVENKIAAAGGAAPVESDLWIYKSIPELQTECMGLFGETKISKGLKFILDKGFIESRNNPKYGWDRTLQYRFQFEAVQAVILRHGSREITTSKTAKSQDESRENTAAIPETSSKTPTEIEKPILPISKENADWNRAFSQLEIQLDRASFDTWVRAAHFLKFEDPIFHIGVPNQYARDMLQHRLYRDVRRVLSNITGQPCELLFEVHKPPPSQPDGELPLFKILAQEPTHAIYRRNRGE